MACERQLQILGIATVAYFCFKFCSFCWLYVRPSSLYQYLADSTTTNDRNWALVTGASDGIGRAFVYELCRRGFNVILHGRNLHKLAAVQDEANQRHPKSQTRIVISDANLSSSSSLKESILDKVRDLKVSILINNVGGTSGVQSLDETYSTIDQCSVEVVDGIIAINARFPSQITRLLVPHLSKRPRSLIMNISSASERGLPYLSVYSATKSYVTAFSKALAAEMKTEKRNVEVLAIIVGSVQVTTNDLPLSIFHPSAETFARAAMERVGCGRTSVCGYLPHALQVSSMAFIPEWLATKLVIETMRARKQAAESQAKAK
jgi:17beta-estradiol 17-dehydrogenase / very-long-chain 3-oxoacyl-CoA reductase